MAPVRAAETIVEAGRALIGGQGKVRTLTESLREFVRNDDVFFIGGFGQGIHGCSRARRHSRSPAPSATSGFAWVRSRSPISPGSMSGGWPAVHGRFLSAKPPIAMMCAVCNSSRTGDACRGQ